MCRDSKSSLATPRAVATSGFDLRLNNSNSAKIASDMTIEEAFKKFLENKYWAELYENAPERVKPFMKANFATSLLRKGDEEYEQAFADLNNAEKQLKKSDCKWLLENEGKNAYARHYFKTLMVNAKE